MIYAKLYQEFCERFGFWPWILMVVLLTSLVLWRGHQKSSIAETEKQLAINACAETGFLPDCQEQIESRHEACFDFNYTGTDIYGSPYLDRTGYRECLEVGFDDYIVEFRARERENLALQRDLLN